MLFSGSKNKIKNHQAWKRHGSVRITNDVFPQHQSGGGWVGLEKRVENLKIGEDNRTKKNTVIVRSLILNCREKEDDGFFFFF